MRLLALNAAHERRAQTELIDEIVLVIVPFIVCFVIRPDFKEIICHDRVGDRLVAERVWCNSYGLVSVLFVNGFFDFGAQVVGVWRCQIPQLRAMLVVSFVDGVAGITYHNVRSSPQVEPASVSQDRVANDGHAGDERVIAVEEGAVVVDSLLSTLYGQLVYECRQRYVHQRLGDDEDLTVVGRRWCVAKGRSRGSRRARRRVCVKQ